MANLKDDKRDMEYHESNRLSSSCGETFKLFLKREFDYIIEISFTGETSQFINLIINKTIPFFIKKNREEIEDIDFIFFYKISNLEFIGNRKTKSEEIFNIIKKECVTYLDKIKLN